MEECNSCHILWVGTGPADWDALATALAQTCGPTEIVRVQDLFTVRQQLHRASFDLVVIHIRTLRAWDIDPVAGFRRLRPDLPILILTERMEDVPPHWLQLAGVYVAADPAQDLTAFVHRVRTIFRDIRAGDADVRHGEDFMDTRDIVPVGLYRVTPDGRWVDANSEMLSILRVRELADLESFPLPRLFCNPSDWAYRIARLTALGVVRNLRVRLQRPDGSTFWGLDNARAVRGADGNVLYHSGALIDISAWLFRDQEQNAVQSVLRALIRRDPDQLFEPAIAELARWFPIDGGVLWLEGSEAQRFRPMTQWLSDMGQLQVPPVIRAYTELMQDPQQRKQTLFAHILQTEREPSVWHMEDRQEPDAALLRQYGFRWIATVVLNARAHPRAVLMILGLGDLSDASVLVHVLQSLEDAFLATLFQWCHLQTVLEERITIERTMQQQITGLTRFQKVTRRLMSVVTLHDMLQQATRSTAALLPADVHVCALQSRDRISVQVLPIRPIHRSLMEDLRTQIRELLGTEDQIPDRSVESTLDTHLLDDTARPIGRIMPVLSIPIVTPEGVQRGIIWIGNERPLNVPNETQILLRAVADQVGIAVERWEQLQELQRRSSAELIEHLPEGIVLIDPSFRVVLANAAGRQYLRELANAREGDTLERLGYVPIEKFLQPLPPDTFAYDVILDTPKRKVFQVIPRPVTITGEPGWILIIWDATREREVEDRMKAFERLTAVGQLAAGIAHDFNNLLTSIMGYAEILQLRPDIPKEAREGLQVIIDQSQQAARLVRQILDFSRKSISRKGPLDLAQTLRENVAMLQRTLPESISVELIVEPGTYMIHGDATQIQQILMNLALNARDAMPKGGTLSIHLQREVITADTVPFRSMPPGEWIRLDIADTGIGIPEDILPYIFEPFFTTKERTRGTGLGLAQVYGLVKQHGGYIDVKSTVGQGTVFHIWFPPLRTEAEAEVPTLHPRAVLVVDDDPSVLDFIRTMIARLGYRALGARSGTEALHILENPPYPVDLVISDVVMEDMRGMELFRQVKSRYPHVRFVLMSGFPFQEDVYALLKEGLDALLSKPFSLSDLWTLINRIFAPRLDNHTES